MADIDGIPLEGVLDCLNDDVDFPDLLMAVSRSGKTGRLRFSNPDGDKVLDVHGGKFVFAKSSSPDDGLGQYLLRSGKVSLVDYDRISKEVRPGKRLGSLLVKDRILDAAALVPAVVGQVRQVILGLFRRNGSSYRFKEAEIEGKERITLNLPISELIIDGIMEVQSWRRVSRGVGGVATLYRVTSIQELGTSSSEHLEEIEQLVAMLQNATSVGQLCTRAKLSDFDVCRYLWAFRVLGWVEEVDLASQADTFVDVQSQEKTAVDVTAQARTVVDVSAHQEKTVMDVAERARRLAALEKTVVDQNTRPDVGTSGKPPEAPASAAPPAASAPDPPKPISPDLLKTQVAVDAPKPADENAPIPDSAWTTEPTEYDPQRTRVFDSPPDVPAEAQELPAPPSTGERMESILEDDGSAGANPGDASTQMFDTPNALDKKKPKPAAGPNPDDATTQFAIDPPEDN